MGENCLNSVVCYGENSPPPYNYDPDSSTLHYNSSHDYNFSLDLNGTSSPPVSENGEKFLIMVITSVLLGLIILATIVGKFSIQNKTLIFIKCFPTIPIHTI